MVGKGTTALVPDRRGRALCKAAPLVLARQEKTGHSPSTAAAGGQRWEDFSFVPDGGGGGGGTPPGDRHHRPSVDGGRVARTSVGAARASRGYLMRSSHLSAVGSCPPLVSHCRRRHGIPCARPPPPPSRLLPTLPPPRPRQSRFLPRAIAPCPSGWHHHDRSGMRVPGRGGHPSSLQWTVSGRPPQRWRGGDGPALGHAQRLEEV